jgi:hypothetical protein
MPTLMAIAGEHDVIRIYSPVLPRGHGGLRCRNFRCCTDTGLAHGLMRVHVVNKCVVIHSPAEASDVDAAAYPLGRRRGGVRHDKLDLTILLGTPRTLRTAVVVARRNRASKITVCKPGKVDVGQALSLDPRLAGDKPR